MTPSEALERITGPYNLNHMRNPAIYLDHLATVLKSYPPEVLTKLADPHGAILTACKFPPTIAEVVEAAEKLTKKRSKNFV